MFRLILLDRDLLTRHESSLSRHRGDRDSEKHHGFNERWRLETPAIPEGQRDAIAERIEKIVFPFAFLVSDAEALDLVKQMIARVPFIYGRLVEREVCVF